jgi:uncharacterized repeat protein (TIGR03803 family)
MTQIQLVALTKSAFTVSAGVAALSMLAMTACGQREAALSPAAGPLAPAAGPLAAPAGAQPDTHLVTPLINFHYGEGAIGPGGSGGLIGDPSKALYGVAAAGGDKECRTHPKDELKGCGFVYELEQQSGDSYKAKRLYTFRREEDGAEPTAALLAGADGSFYGTTALGGKHRMGTVYKLSPSRDGRYTESVLWSFGAGDDGRYPYASLIALNNTLYGTTGYGGANKKACSSGCGVAFSITTAGKERVLHSFGSTNDGATPLASLVDVNGTLYGTTNAGGGTAHNRFCESDGNGTVFSMSTTGVEQVLYSFTGGPGGCNPLGSGVVAVNGALYGTTSGGGTTKCECGIIYSLTLSGTETILHLFSGPGGQNPRASLVELDGSLYGTTFYGGSHTCPENNNGCGGVFSLEPSGSPNFRSVYEFPGQRDGADPAAPLLGYGSSLYGTTSAAGKNGRGIAFKLTPPTNDRLLAVTRR